MNSKLVALALVGSLTLGGVVILSEEYASNDSLDEASTVQEICDAVKANSPHKYEAIEIPCNDLHNKTLSEEILCSEEGDAGFTFLELVSGDDPEGAFYEVAGRCGAVTDFGQTRRRLGESRKTAVDYGWCSMNIGFITGNSADSSDYCTQLHHPGCDSMLGCGDSVSNCCIGHDRCLQISNTGICGCDRRSGGQCDIELSHCASRVSCWRGRGWRRWWNPACGAAAWAIKNIMARQPNKDWKPGGYNC